VGVPDNVAAASDDVIALLRAYDGLLRWERELPRVLWLRRGRYGLTRHVRVPRLRLGLRWMLIDHMERTLRSLRAELDARRMVTSNPADDADRAAVEACLQSLSSIPRKRLSLFAAVAVVGVAHLLAHGNDSAEPLGELTRNIAGISPDKAVDALSDFNSLNRVAFSVLFLCLAIYLVLCIPMTAFRLKRILCNLGPEHRDRLHDVATAEHVALSTGVYDLERSICHRLDPRAPMGEPPLDLLVGAALVVPAIWAVAAIAYISRDDVSFGSPGLNEVWLPALLIQLLLLPLGRLAWLMRAAAMRRRGERPILPSDLAIPSRRRRAAAGAIDTTAVLVLALLVLAGLAQLHEMAAILLAPTLGAAVYSSISLLAGATFGRRWLGLEVHDRNGGRARPAQVFARDALLKWGVVNTLGFALLWVHVVVIYLWPLWDPQRRTLYDMIADTVLVRAHPEPAAALVPSLQP
jgi:uncharacterized RDD family membrane protein YckC